jgi:hypothetical protein
LYAALHHSAHQTSEYSITLLHNCLSGNAQSGLPLRVKFVNCRADFRDVAAYDVPLAALRRVHGTMFALVDIKAWVLAELFRMRNTG